jgi:integrase
MERPMAIKKVKIGNGETKWEVRIRSKGLDTKRLRRRFDRKSDAEEFVMNLQLKIQEEAKLPEVENKLKSRTFREEAEFWFEDGKMRFSESHQKRVTGILNELLPKYGDLTIDSFTPELLSKIQREEKAKGLSDSTVNRKTEVIQAILVFSNKQQRIPLNPSSGFRKLRKSTEEMAFWHKAEAHSFLSKMNELYPKDSEKRWVFAVYLLALNTALRAGEIWGLKVSDISPDGRSLWIKRQFNRVTNTFTTTKGKRARHVPCSQDLLFEIRRIIERSDLNPDDTIFRSKKGQPVSHDMFSVKQFQMDVARWGGRQIRFHDLRHTATTLMIAHGVDLNTVRAICGHISIVTTMEYAHLIAGSVATVGDTFSLNPLNTRASFSDSN